jgi:flagellar protein FlgJ
MTHGAHMANLHQLSPSLVQTRNPSAAAAASPRLRKAAQEFEANFLQELLKPLKEDPLFAGSDGLGGSDGADGMMSGSLGTVDSLGTQALADALAAAGGLGIAQHVLAQMAPIEAADEAAKRASNAGTAAAGALSGTGEDDATGKKMHGLRRTASPIALPQQRLAVHPLR